MLISVNGLLHMPQLMRILIRQCLQKPDDLDTVFKMKRRVKIMAYLDVYSVAWLQLLALHLCDLVVVVTYESQVE